MRDRPAEEAVLDRRRQGLAALLQSARAGRWCPRRGPRALRRGPVSGGGAPGHPGAAGVRDRRDVPGLDHGGPPHLRGRPRPGAPRRPREPGRRGGGRLRRRGRVRRPRGPARAASAAVLRTRINLIAVDARRVEVVGPPPERRRGGGADRQGAAVRVRGHRVRARDPRPPRARHRAAGGDRRPGAHRGGHAAPAPRPRRREGVPRPAVDLDGGVAGRGPRHRPRAPAPAARAAADVSEPPAERIARLQREVAALRAEFVELAAKDALVEKGAAAEGHLTASVSPRSSRPWSAGSPTATSTAWPSTSTA